jgi:hypothetical protein
MQTQILNFEDYNGALEEQFMTCEAHYNASFRLPYSHAYRHFERLNQWLARSERNFPQPLYPARLSSARSGKIRGNRPQECHRKRYGHEELTGEWVGALIEPQSASHAFVTNIADSKGGLP